MSDRLHDAFAYRADEDDTRVLHVEDVPVPSIAQRLGTPFYCYASATMVDLYGRFAAALEGTRALICYALKANDNLAVIQSFARLGAGADVVSEGELRFARAAGVPAERIVFSGVGKTEAELAFALDEGILQFNVESAPELARLNAIALDKGLRAPIALRVNPDVAAATHDKVSTGRRHDKFGIALEQIPALYAEAARLPGVTLMGLALHIGSQITELSPFETAITRVVELALRLKGQGLPLTRLDLGGGLGIDYGDDRPPSVKDYGALLSRLTAKLDIELAIEPGRALIGPAGLLVTRVVYLKEAGDRTFVIVDAAMNDMLRPALYGAEHPALPVVEPDPRAPQGPVDIVGPVCESADTFARDRLMPPLQPGELIAFGQAGAYGAVMASSYNRRPLVPEALVKGTAVATIRERWGYAELLARERRPDWLA